MAVQELERLLERAVAEALGVARPEVPARLRSARTRRHQMAKRWRLAPRHRRAA